MIGCLPRFKIVQHDRSPVGITHGTPFMLMGCGLTLCVVTHPCDILFQVKLQSI